MRSANILTYLLTWAHGAALISVSIALSQTPAYTDCDTVYYLLSGLFCLLTFLTVAVECVEMFQDYLVLIAQLEHQQHLVSLFSLYPTVNIYRVTR